MPTTLFSEKFLNESSRNQLAKHRSIMKARVQHIDRSNPEFQKISAECTHIDDVKESSDFSTVITAASDGRFVYRRGHGDSTTI